MTRGVKFYLTILLVVILIAFIAVLLFLPREKNLEVIFLDIGQGDSILIKTPFGQNILIDGGPDKSVLKGLGKNLAWWDREIDLMILTHPHDDHVTGLIEVLKRYKVKKILYTGVTHNAPNYIKWLEVIKEKNIPLVISDKIQKINLGENCFFEIIYPDTSFLNKDVGNLNNSSIVAKLVYRENSFLFTGDIEKETEEVLLKNKANLKADILKVAHHGSDTGSSEEFLERVSPKTAVILVGQDNDFGHPSKRVLIRLEKNDVKIMRTDREGEIKLKSDGKNIKINN